MRAYFTLWFFANFLKPLRNDSRVYLEYFRSPEVKKIVKFDPKSKKIVRNSPISYLRHPKRSLDKLNGYDWVDIDKTDIKA